MLRSDESHAQAHRQRMLQKKIWDQAEPIVIYQSRRSPLLWLLTLFIFLTFVTSIYFSLTMPLDEYSSSFSARVWQLIFIFLPGLILCSNLWLSGKYVLKLEVLPGKKLRVTIWSIFYIKKICIWRAEDFEPNASFYEGWTEIVGKPKVHAPFLLYKLRNGAKLLLDLQAEMPNGPLVAMRLFGR